MARVLVVDDDVRMSDFLRGQFQAAGHECLVADTGEKALEAAKTGMADLLVLDVMLPGGVSGFEVCRRIRADSDTFTLPILMLSAMCEEEEILHGIAQGADDYVAKPFEVNNLVQRVERLLRTNMDVGVPDGVTSLPGAGAFKREVQRRVTRHEPFALACTEMLRLREFAYKGRAEARQKAIVHLARALNGCGKAMNDESFTLAHMGGGYFACVLDADNAERYAKWVIATWNSYLPALYDSIGLLDAYNEARERPAKNAKFPILGLLICLTACNHKETVKAQDLFETLMRIRNKALAERTEGIHYDRRVASD